MLEEFSSCSVLAEVAKDVYIRCLLWVCDPGSGFYSGFSISLINIPEAWSEIKQPAVFASVGPATESQAQQAYWHVCF